MKYERTTKTVRNKMVRDYHNAHPELSLKEIGDIFNISKQRVSVLISKGDGHKVVADKAADKMNGE